MIIDKNDGRDFILSLIIFLNQLIATLKQYKIWSH